jgi:hypothetical protein
MEQRNALRFQGNKKIIRNAINKPVRIRGLASWAIAPQEALVKGLFLPKCDGGQFLADARFS